MIIIFLGVLCDGRTLRKQRHVIESPLRRKMDLHFILRSIDPSSNEGTSESLVGTSASLLSDETRTTFTSFFLPPIIIEIH